MQSTSYSQSGQTKRNKIFFSLLTAVMAAQFSEPAERTELGE